MIQACVVALTLFSVNASTDWAQVASSNGTTVLGRDAPGSEVKEFKATGQIDAPPQEVLALLEDWSRYGQVNSYTKEVRILATENGGKVSYLYVILSPPLISPRDYTLKYEDFSDWKEGAGFLGMRWHVTERPETAKPRDGAVHVKTHEGEWRLEPRDNGAHTFATYSLHSDPGGALPHWIVNKLASNGLLDMFKAVRKNVATKSGK